MNNKITASMNDKLNALGFGLGLRTDHYQEIIDTKPAIDWFEILSENYLVPGGKPLYYLDQIKEHYPIVMHGVSMSLGSMDPLNWDYLKQLKALAKRVDAHWVSDHLCWTGIHHKNMHDLLPLPLTEEALRHITQKISEAQDFLGRQLLIENPSTYLSFKQDEMTEWDFLAEMTTQADCLLLLDVNNIYVSSFNHQFNPDDYLAGIPLGRVQQIHLAGHSNNGDHIIDTHDATVIDKVWEIYGKALVRFGFVSTMIERDDHIPPLQELIDELGRAKTIAQQVLQPARVSA